MPLMLAMHGVPLCAQAIERIEAVEVVGHYDNRIGTQVQQRAALYVAARAR
jgi:hypothetical protein